MNAVARLLDESEHRAKAGVFGVLEFENDRPGARKALEQAGFSSDIDSVNDAAYIAFDPVHGRCAIAVKYFWSDDYFWTGKKRLKNGNVVLIKFSNGNVVSDDGPQEEIKAQALNWVKTGKVVS